MSAGMPESGVLLSTYTRNNASFPSRIWENLTETEGKAGEYWTHVRSLHLRVTIILQNGHYFTGNLGVGIYRLLHLECIDNKVPLYSTGNYI